MRAARFLGTTAGAVAVTVALAGPGLLRSPAGASASPSGARRLLAEAVKGLAHARNFAISGSIVQDSQHFGLDVRGRDGGASAAGTLLLGKDGPGTPRLDFVKLGRAIDVRANASFWVTEGGRSPLPKAVVRSLEGQWVKLTGASFTSLKRALKSFTVPSSIASSLLGSAKDTLRLGRRTRIGAVRVQAIVDERAKGTMYVSLGARPRPVELVGDAPHSRGEFRFRYPRSLVITAPAAVPTITSRIVSALKG